VNELPKQIGVILSGSTTISAPCQLLEDAEREVREGMFVIIKTKLAKNEVKILGRVTNLRAYNEFFEEGDVWSEARRKGKIIPEEIARRYVTCDIELLGTLPRLDDVKIPPSPGDQVFLLENSEEIFREIKRKGEIYINFGTLYGYEKAPVPLTIEAIPMHIGVIGVTGSGKSYTVGYLLEKLGNIKTEKGIFGFPAIIIDANGDYLDYYFESLEGKYRSGYTEIIRLVFPESLAAKEDKNARKIKLDMNLLEPRELAELIIDFYKGAEQGSELAITLLENIFEELKYEGADMNLMLSDPDFYRSRIINRIDSIPREIAHSATKGAARRALDNFVKELRNNRLFAIESLKAVDYSFIDEITEYYKLAIFDYSTDGATGISVKLKQLVVAYLSIILYKRFVDYKMGRAGGGGTRYALFIIEEAQYYCPNLKVYPVGSSVARKYLSLIATQGRKFGLSLLLITQRPLFVDPIVLSMLNTFIIHRVSPEDLGYLNRILGGLPKVFKDRLTNLETGVAVITGQMLPVSFPILVRIPGERKVKPKIGATNVSNFFRR